MGLLAGAALPLGAAAGLFLKLPQRAVAGVMAFGAGTLIAALALVLMEDAHRHGGIWTASIGFPAGHGASYVLGIWSAIGVLTGVAALGGYAAFSSSTDAGIAGASAVAAGAIVAMLVDTLIPEAYEGAHDFSGLITAARFLLAFALHNTTA
jgi:ZIP family zinc transporter